MLYISLCLFETKVIDIKDNFAFSVLLYMINLVFEKATVLVFKKQKLLR
jgi:hypothetical protein